MASIPIEWPHPVPWVAEGTPPPSGGPAGPAGPEGPQGPAGEGLPIGGTAGDVLVKSSDTDHHCEWKPPVALR